MNCLESLLNTEPETLQNCGFLTLSVVEYISYFIRGNGKYYHW